MQERIAWCRSCGEIDRYPTGWSLLERADFEALRNAVRAPIVGTPMGSTGHVSVRLRLRHLACRRCLERGMLVAGHPPRVARLR